MKVPVVLLIAVVCFWGCSSSRNSVSIKSKTAESSFVKVTDSLYAGTTEVTNAEYRDFLNDLIAKGQLDLYKKYKVDSTRWRMSMAYCEPYVGVYQWHPAYAAYPVVNVSYDAAVAYCNWLTEQYAKNPKKGGEKIIFRLPNEEEWKLAARGGSKEAEFPWYGFTMQNSKGQWLANFHVVSQANLKDTTINDVAQVTGVQGIDFSAVSGNQSYSGFITTPAKSYWPNNFGLYNMAGNVSEMLAEKGRTKGGNWHSTGYYLRIDAEDEFGGKALEPSPFVGFRVFAEVVK